MPTSNFATEDTGHRLQDLPYRTIPWERERVTPTSSEAGRLVLTVLIVVWLLSTVLMVLWLLPLMRMVAAAVAVVEWLLLL